MFGQQRSQSGPAGLSINTSSANSLLSPSNVNQPPPSGGLFGSLAQQKPLGIFGSSTNTTQAPSSGAPFGASTSNLGGLFGSQSQQAASSAQSSQTGGLFGSQPVNNSQQLGGSLFGGQVTQQQGGGLFGSSNAQQPQAQQAGGIFGSLGQTQSQQQQQPPPQQQIGGLLGGVQTQGKPSLFGNSITQGPVQQRPPLMSQPSNFAQSQQQQKSAFSSSIGQYTQQQQTVPGVRVDLSGLRPTTRFNDLYEEIQKIIEGVDNFVLTQMNLAEQCEQAMPKVESTFSYIPNDVEFCSRKLDTMQQALENDAEIIDGTKKLVKREAADARLSFMAIQNLRMPQQFHQSGLWNIPTTSQVPGPTILDEDTEEGASSDLVSYFTKQTEGMSKTLESYKRNVAEVEAYLRGVEATTVHQMQRVQFTRGRDGGERSADDQVRELAAVLREFEHGILGVAGKVGGVREKVQERMLGEKGSWSRPLG